MLRKPCRQMPAVSGALASADHFQRADARMNMLQNTGVWPPAPPSTGK